MTRIYVAEKVRPLYQHKTQNNMTQQRPHKNTILHINKRFHIYERCEVP
jgi:hypothetical protein